MQSKTLKVDLKKIGTELVYAWLINAALLTTHAVDAWASESDLFRCILLTAGALSMSFMFGSACGFRYEVQKALKVQKQKNERGE